MTPSTEFPCKIIAHGKGGGGGGGGGGGNSNLAFSGVDAASEKLFEREGGGGHSGRRRVLRGLEYAGRWVWSRWTNAAGGWGWRRRQREEEEEEEEGKAAKEVVF